MCFGRLSSAEGLEIAPDEPWAKGVVELGFVGRGLQPEAAPASARVATNGAAKQKCVLIRTKRREPDQQTMGRDIPSYSHILRNPIKLL